MSASSLLRDELQSLARRSVEIKGACRNEESTKLYLALPFVRLLGFDYSNPLEVYPEHDATFDDRQPNKVDLAVMRGGEPVIAIECKHVGADLRQARGQLRGYYNALPTTKLAILTDGITFEFFVDSEEPNLMDEEPFLTLDLDVISRNGAAVDALEMLAHMSKEAFNPDTIAELAHVQLVKKRLRISFVEEANSPSEDFCRHFLLKAGLKNVRKAAIDRYYAPMIKTAFNEALVLPMAELFRKSHEDGTLGSSDERVVTTERELSLFNYIRRRLAFLVKEEKSFRAIEAVSYKDYLGKLIVFYDKERKGRLFDFVEGANGFDKFIFPKPYGEIVTNNMLDIDEALRAVFMARVREIGSPRVAVRLADIA
jgi:predicted type IV restriction endonuclease